MVSLGLYGKLVSYLLVSYERVTIRPKGEGLRPRRDLWSYITSWPKDAFSVTQFHRAKLVFKACIYGKHWSEVSIA